ncbi:TetR/AcrR family transcriptional regulator [Lentzea sp. NPDC059081]|uniref:TetR/AcrR family transcriptional regulator n=1 Tax=Lentzea sp. NPDC059081 TaxID=3346719 RepID=UPI0036B36743
MSAPTPSRPVRADAERNVARILEAAKVVLADDPAASLERIADEAGLARATVHRRFSSRKALLDTLFAQLNDQYLRALDEAKVETAPPLVALHRITELVIGIKFSQRFVVDLVSRVNSDHPTLSDEVLERSRGLFARLHAAGAIAASSPDWCLRVYLAVLDAVNQLPPGAPELGGSGDDVAARTSLQVSTVLGALGGVRPQ